MSDTINLKFTLKEAPSNINGFTLILPLRVSYTGDLRLQFQDTIQLNFNSKFSKANLAGELVLYQRDNIDQK